MTISHTPTFRVESSLSPKTGDRWFYVVETEPYASRSYVIARRDTEGKADDYAVRCRREVKRNRQWYNRRKPK